ncbi:MAG: DUF1993 domain-containing protein [Burkholderiaceae bacterium]
MALSLYQMSIPNYVQALGGVEGYLAKGLEHCASNGIDPQTIVQTTLYEDMWTFDKQVQSICHHSLGAINGIKNGVFNPPKFNPDIDYEELVRLTSQARSELEALSESDVNDLSGKDMRFEAGERKMPFIAEDFVLSFSFPNFYFHATTAYDILRHKGVEIGKRDFIGRMRINKS